MIKSKIKKTQIDAIEVNFSQNSKMYVASIAVATLLKCCHISRADENAKTGFQRVLSPARPKKIAAYIDSGKIIPGSIVLSAKKSSELTYLKSKKKITFNIDTKSFLIIDGQHRLYGAEKSKTAIELPVSILTDLDLSEEVQYFIDVNGEQRGVPRTLQIEVEKFISEEGSPTDICIKLFHDLNVRADSPLCGKMSATKSMVGMLTHVPFSKSIMPLLTSSALARLSYDQKLTVLVNFLNATQTVLSSNKEVKDKLTNAAFFTALFHSFNTIMVLTMEKSHNYKEQSFLKIIKPIEDIKWDFYHGTNQKVVKELSEHIVNLVSSSAKIEDDLF